MTAHVEHAQAVSIWYDHPCLDAGIGLLSSETADEPIGPSCPIQLGTRRPIPSARRPYGLLAFCIKSFRGESRSTLAVGLT